MKYTTKSSHTFKNLINVDTLHHARQTNGQQQLHLLGINLAALLITIFHIDGRDVHTLPPDFFETRPAFFLFFFET